MRLRDALRHDPGGPSFAGLEPDATPKAPGGKRRTLAKLEQRGVELADLQERLYAASTAGATRRVLLVLQGMDTCGKGGTVKHVIGLVNPQGVAIARSRRRRAEELRHHFLWRIAPPRSRRPGARHLRPLALRGRPDRARPRPGARATDRAPLRRDQPRSRPSLADEGVAIVKVFLHLSFEEQRERLLARLRRPRQALEVQPRRRRGAPALGPTTRSAYDLALERCSTEHAPWYVVPADHKWYRNWAVGRLLLETLRELDPQYPRPDLDVEELERRLRHDDVVVAEPAPA